MDEQGAGDAARTAAVRRHAAALARTLVRPGAYAGAAREAAIGAFSVATYPLGLRAAPAACAPRHTATRSRSVAPDVARMPIVLVHGYFHNRSAFLSMGRSLRRAGFPYVHTLNYNPLAHDVFALARQLDREVEHVLETTGASRVQIVGHSMGGIVARTYVQTMAADERVDTVITLGTPHRGTHAARFGAGPAARQLRPGSPFLRILEETARPTAVRWISYYSDLDAMIIPTSSGKLVHPALHAVNVMSRDTGHLSLLMNGEVLRGIVGYLSDPALGRAPAAATAGPTDAAAG
jgi:triacylglycerol lipase